MRVKVSVYAILRETLGWREKYVEIEGKSSATINEVLKCLPELHNILQSNNTIIETYMILVDGVNIRLRRGLNTEVGDGSEISIIPPAGGG